MVGKGWPPNKVVAVTAMLSVGGMTVVFSETTELTQVMQPLLALKYEPVSETAGFAINEPESGQYLPPPP